MECSEDGEVIVYCSYQLACLRCRVDQEGPTLPDRDEWLDVFLAYGYNIGEIGGGVVFREGDVKD